MQIIKNLLFAFICLSILESQFAAAAVLRKKSGRAIIMGFSRIELERYSTGQFILIENYQKNQWVGQIKKIYRVNRIRITLTEDDSEDMEVGEVFQIKPSEAPQSIGKPEFDPSEFPVEDEPESPAEMKLKPSVSGESKPPGPPLFSDRPPAPPPEQSHFNLSLGMLTRYYIVPPGNSEGNLHGTGTQLQGTFIFVKGFGINLGLRQEELVYSGVDEFSNYSVAVISYFTGFSYVWHFVNWSLGSGLRSTIQGKGEGSLENVLVGADGKAFSVVVRGVGTTKESNAWLSLSYDWAHVYVFAEASISIASRISTKYRTQLRGTDPFGNEAIQEYRTESNFLTQVQGMTVGLGVAL